MKELNYFDHSFLYATSLMQNLLQVSGFLPIDLVKVIITETITISKVLFDDYKNDANKINNYLEFYKFIKLIYSKA